MLKSYKYRIYPNDSQKALIEQTFNACRLVYNLGLGIKIDAYKQHGIKLSSFNLCYQLVDLKNENNWLKEVDSQALQASVKKIDVAFKNFYNGNGYPKFKKKSNNQTFQCPHSPRKVDFDRGLLTIPKIKNIPIKITRKFTGKVKTVTISRTATNKYYASILVDNGCNYPDKQPIESDTAIGIDLGIKNFAIFSDGTICDNPKYLRNSQERLKILQRRVSKKIKGSANRKKAIKRVAILHEIITNQRNDFLHKFSDAITKQYDTICVEDLNIAGMVKNHKLAHAISDVSWSEFVRQLKYKAKWRGKNIIQIGRFEASTKTCSNCGVKNETLTLKDREWTCAFCLSIHDRDVNAAINIKQIGLKNQGGVHP